MAKCSKPMIFCQEKNSYGPVFSSSFSGRFNFIGSLRSIILINLKKKFRWKILKMQKVRDVFWKIFEIFEIFWNFRTFSKISKILYRTSYRKFRKFWNFQKSQNFRKFFENFSKSRNWKYAFDFFALRCAVDSHFPLRPTFLTSPDALNAQSPLLSNALPHAYKLANHAKREPKN